jgi:hypothetical protein
MYRATFVYCGTENVREILDAVRGHRENATTLP